MAVQTISTTQVTYPRYLDPYYLGRPAEGTAETWDDTCTGLLDRGIGQFSPRALLAQKPMLKGSSR
jgi:hypothetical protein